MRKVNINHKRITAIVRQELDSAIWKARDYEQEQKKNGSSELAGIMGQNVIPGIEFDKVGSVQRVFITINDEILTLVGYDDNLEGFLADYFGSDYKPMEGESLRFRYIDGFLVNPTVRNNIK